MKKLLTFGLSAILAGYCLQGAAQDKRLSTLTKEDIIADYQLSVEILKKQHPNPYKFIDSVSFERKVDSLVKKMSAQPDLLSCLQYSPVYLVRDVHTNISFSSDNGKELYSMIIFFPSRW